MNQLSGAGFRRGILAEEYARHGDLYRAQETVRIAAYQHAIDGLQAEAQLYDPSSSSTIKIGHAIDAITAQKALTENALQQQTNKNNFEVIKLQQEQQKVAETERHNRATEAEALLKASAKLGAGGAGAARVFGAAPQYTVDTGLTNPFDRTQPLFGVRQIGGKGIDPKERASVEIAINSYAHAQDGWARLAAIGKLIDYHKGLGESVWSKFKKTDAAEYDAATHSLVVDLTKELGDKLTQGQIDEQGKRIPQRASWLEDRDVGKMIRDAQEEADQHLSRDLTLNGVNPDPVISSARQYRETTMPTPEQQVDAATAQLSRNPDDKDAKRDLALGQQRQQQEAVAEQTRTHDITAARALSPGPGALPEYNATAVLSGQEQHANYDELKSEQAEIAKAVDEANRLGSHYDAARKAFEAADTTGHLKGLRQPGDIAAANQAHELKLGELAKQALDQQAVAAAARAKADALIAEQARRNRIEVRQNAVAAGLNPDISPIPDRGLLDKFVPNRDYAPGTNPLEPPPRQSYQSPLAVPIAKPRKR